MNQKKKTKAKVLLQDGQASLDRFCTMQTHWEAKFWEEMDKRRVTESQAAAEEAAHCGDTKELYTMIRATYRKTLDIYFILT